MIRLILLGISSFAVSKFGKIPGVTLPLSATISLALLLDNKKSDASAIAAGSLVGNAMNIVFGSGNSGNFNNVNNSGIINSELLKLQEESPNFNFFLIDNDRIFHNNKLIDIDSFILLAKESKLNNKIVSLVANERNTTFGFGNKLTDILRENKIPFSEIPPNAINPKVFENLGK